MRSAPSRLPPILDQVLVLIAAEPEFSESQLSRALIAAEAERITPLIALNKSDLGEPFQRAWQRLAPYRQMGYTVLPLALEPASTSGVTRTDVNAALQTALAGKTTLVLGALRGAGKSTLINRLVPGRASVDQRDFAGSEFGQTHHHPHLLVLGRCRAWNSP